ncbi:L-2-hydroxyglutarate oxidase LhgO [Klebsiella pneumoniae]|nr:L-2-hydroxyglutarate oxidase LhgO [Klebsiella pneumoniae]
MLGVDPGFIICPFRGEYFQLAPQHNQIVNHLIYPIPDPAMPFLGVHLTRMIDGSVTVGPNAVLALKREGYRKRDISLADTRRSSLARHPPGTAKQPALRTGRNEEFAVQKRLSAAGAKYCPSLTLSDLRPWPAGVGAAVPAGQADRRFSLRYHRAFDTYLQCAIASGHLRYPDRRAYRQQGAEPAGQPEQSRTHAACGT